MKKYICCSLVLLTLCTGSSFAQIRTEGTRIETDSASGITKKTTYVEVKEEEVITPRHDMITINPLKFILFYNLSYYHAFSGVVTAGLGLQMPTLSHLSGFGINAEVRLYPSNKALRGFYVAPNFSYNHLKYDWEGYYFSDGSNTFSTSASSIGVLIGWQWFIGDDFAIGLGIGIDHYFESGTGSDYSVFSNYSGNAPALRFDIGYGW